MDVPRKYGLLRAVAFLMKLLAWLVLLSGIIGGILALAFLRGPLPLTGGLDLPLWTAGAGWAGVLLACVIAFVQLFAFGSVLSLLIDIEENTRALAGPPPE